MGIHSPSQYVTLTLFPLQQWLQERASNLRFTFTASLCLVLSLICLLKITQVLQELTTNTKFNACVSQVPGFYRRNSPCHSITEIHNATIKKACS